MILTLSIGTLKTTPMETMLIAPNTAWTNGW